VGELTNRIAGEEFVDSNGKRHEGWIPAIRLSRKEAGAQSKRRHELIGIVPGMPAEPVKDPQINAPCARALRITFEMAEQMLHGRVLRFPGLYAFAVLDPEVDLSFAEWSRLVQLELTENLRRFNRRV
jgi:hypothetical protein